jgi:flagellar motor protein MotB
MGDAEDKYDIVWNDSDFQPNLNSTVYGVVAVSDELLANKAMLKLFVYGALKAAEDVDLSDYSYIRSVLPSVNTEEKFIEEQIRNIEYINYRENIRIINNEYLHNQMDRKGKISPYTLRVLHAPLERVHAPGEPVVEITPEGVHSSYNIEAYFRSSSSSLFTNQEHAYSVINDFIEFANSDENKEFKIKVIGYISNLRGQAFESDRVLATNRARTINNYLLANGIDESRLLEPEGKYGAESRATNENAIIMRKVRIEFHY